MYFSSTAICSPTSSGQNTGTPTVPPPPYTFGVSKSIPCNSSCTSGESICSMQSRTQCRRVSYFTCSTSLITFRSNGSFAVNLFKKSRELTCRLAPFLGVRVLVVVAAAAVRFAHPAAPLQAYRAALHP